MTPYTRRVVEPPPGKLDPQVTRVYARFLAADWLAEVLRGNRFGHAGRLFACEQRQVANGDAVVDELYRLIDSLRKPAALLPWYSEQLAGHEPACRDSGVCLGCGCTESNACPGGCAWSNPERTVCTACSDAALEARR